MEKRRCDNANLDLSVLGLGCWSFGGGDYWGTTAQKDANEVIQEAVQLGINYFDTAEIYNEGRSEESLGLAIKGIPRDKIIIGSKVNTSNAYHDQIISHCEASLKRLGTDYIDIYMLHWPIHPYSIMHSSDDDGCVINPPTYEEVAEAMKLLKTQGKIKHFGISNFRPRPMKSLPLRDVSVNQIPYNLLSRAVEYDVLDFCKENGIGTIAYMALLQGILTDLYTSLDAVPKQFRRTRHFNSESLPDCRHGEKGFEQETQDALLGIKRICAETGHSISEIALKWILANPLITCSLIGVRSVQKLEANMKAVSTPLDADIKAELDKITHPLMKAMGNHIDLWENPKNDRTM